MHNYYASSLLISLSVYLHELRLLRNLISPSNFWAESLLQCKRYRQLRHIYPKRGLSVWVLSLTFVNGAPH